MDGLPGGFYLTDLAGVILGVVFTLVILVVVVWFDKALKSDENYECPLVVGIRGLAFGGLAYIGLIFLDIVLKMLIVLPTKPNAWPYHLGGLILCTVFSMFLLFGAVFVAPTWKTLVTFGLMLGIFHIYFQLAITMDNLADVVNYFNGIFVVWVVQIALTGIERLLNQFNLISEAKPLWNLSGWFKQTLVKPVLIGLWLLFVVELILRTQGFALFYW